MGAGHSIGLLEERNDQAGFMRCAAIAQVAAAQSSRPIDDAALKNAGRTGEDWISYNVNWSEQRYSPLDQINASNVSNWAWRWYTRHSSRAGPSADPSGRNAAGA